MSTQLHLARGIVNGRVHADRDHAQLRDVELAAADARAARRGRLSWVTRSR